MRTAEVTESADQQEAAPQLGEAEEAITGGWTNLVEGAVKNGTTTTVGTLPTAWASAAGNTRSGPKLAV